jgi:hypothetical protein
MSRSRTTILICAIAVAALAGRLYRLDDVPGEWYGDISIVQRYVAYILAGDWPFYYALSAGPLYHYFITPVIALLGHGYMAYKAASVAMSLLAIGSMMLLAYEIAGVRLSLATGLLGAVSSWLLVFSRLGNSQIAIPLLTALMAYFVVRFVKHGKARHAVLGAAVSAVGLYSYPQTYVLPPVFLTLLAAYVWVYKRKTPQTRTFAACLVIIAFMAMPFLIIVQHQPDNFQSGYVGGKLLGSGQFVVQDFVVTLGKNLVTTLGMLHIRGDSIFRSNPPSLPHLDVVSGIFLTFGLWGFINRGQRRFAPLFLISIALLIVPASWPYVLPGEIPSASRTIGIVPFVYILAANGLLWVYETIRGKGNALGAIMHSDALQRVAPIPSRSDGIRKSAAQSTLGVAVILIVLLNFQRYFDFYAWNLPNHNIAYGKTIAAEIDHLPEDTSVYVGGCCWGDWGQPEPEAISFQVKTSRKITVINLTKVPLDLIRAEPSPKHFFWDPRDETKGFAELVQALPGGQVGRRVDEFGGVMYLEYKVP